MGGDVAVIIVNWNGKHYLEPCLRAVLAQTYREMEVVLVDNGSEDGSVEFVAERFPSVRILTNARNLGFAAANNQGIEATGAEFVAVLNNDAYADRSWLENLIAAMEIDPRVGSCASKMLLADEQDIIDSAGIEVNAVGIAWGRSGGLHESEEPAHDSISDVFGASGGAALYRRAMLSEIGLFDPDFFAYLEDVDLAWRARLAGWRCLYVPAARVYHVHSATAGRDSAFKARLLGRNRLWMIMKNYPMPELLWHLGPIVLYDALAVGYRLVRRKDLATLRGRLEALCGMRQALKKRRIVQRLRSAQFSGIGLQPLDGPLRLLARYRFLAKPASSAVLASHSPEVADRIQSAGSCSREEAGCTHQLTVTNVMEKE